MCYPREIRLFIFILTAKISTPFSSFKLDRNPRYRNAGNFMRLSDFLDFTKDKDLSGIMISVEVKILMLVSVYEHTYIYLFISLLYRNVIAVLLLLLNH